jgi:ABC-2 type transport system ATP-binding protein
VGRNGSGKSTMLKLLAGIYSPDAGHIEINGKLTPFIELGVGFNPELTGRENVFLNGALLGFDRKQMEAMYDEIVEFAELEKFMDQKLKNYSSGMQVRLAFSIAIRANTDVLLLDEVLAVGDEAFQRKCYQYFANLKKHKRTVVFVSHDMDAVKNFCDKALLIHKGEIVKVGESTKVATEYSKLNAEDINSKATQKKSNDVMRWGNGVATIERVFITSAGKSTNVIRINQPLEINFEITAHKDIEKSIIGMVMQNSFGHYVFATNTLEKKIDVKIIKKDTKIICTFNLRENIYTNGEYTISGAITNKGRSEVYSRVEEAVSFTVLGWPMAHAVAHPEHDIQITMLKG